jgi:hypothetical protein
VEPQVLKVLKGEFLLQDQREHKEHKEDRDFSELKEQEDP